ncbi:hypothetical protein NESM_000648300 [Novymonas esmeraldas]|uniref:Inositol-1,3,4-trisphosphate 5/6-kinase n=1 Tax=Novymonas esmeraldas TaxID=1808958 RepID=A0AAW0EUD8_9TRYP
MGRSTSPSPEASAPPATPRTITIALCASAKKHQQSFDALRAAATEHNERLLHRLQHPAAGESGVRASVPQDDCVSTNSGRRGTPSRSRSPGAVLSARSGGASNNDAPSRTIVDGYIFRFLHLNYDAQRHRMVVCVHSEIKGEQPPPPTAAAAAAGGGGGGGKARTGRGSRDDGHAATDDAASDATENSQSALAAEVDVVLHKVATFGTPSAIRALERWCKATQKRRSQQRRAPLVVVDPLEKVHLLLTRSMLYKILDNPGDDGRPVALIPRTFMWDCPGTGSRRRASRAGGPTTATPLGLHSFALMEEGEQREARASGSAAGRWWIAKPDEGTGPAFTHHLVMWRTRDVDVTVPPAVQAVLPPEARRFIVQELYVYALPVVLKVYCVGTHIYVKAKPTVNLLAHLWDHTRASTALDVPVTMDSQDKSFFSTVASTSTSPSRPALSAATSGAEYSSQPIHVATPSVPGAAAAEQPAPIEWESMIAPERRWSAFLAPDTPAYAAIEKLAQNLSGSAGIGLSLYGFDIILVPQHLAHTYQRKGEHGIGHADGAAVRHDGVASAIAKLASRVSAADGAVDAAAAAATAATRPSSDNDARVRPGACASEPTTAPQPFRASDMFDPATGAATPLLLDSVPVVIDVNYFPGYTGVGEANQHMLELIARRVTAQAQNGAPHSKSGARAAKRRCTAM